MKAKQIAPGAVGTSEVKDGLLLKTDFKAGQLPGGATGPQGVAGAPGHPVPSVEAVRDAFVDGLNRLDWAALDN